MSLFGKQQEEPVVRARTNLGERTTERTEEPARKRLLGAERGRADRSGNPHQAGGTDVASLGKSIVFKGDLTGEEDLEIEGRVEGQVKLPNNQLTVGGHGRVAAQVEAKNVIVVGHIAGDVIATERVEIQATGVVDGDIHSPRLLIQEGAVVNGSIEMGGASAPKTVGHPPTEAPRQTG